MAPILNQHFCGKTKQLQKVTPITNGIWDGIQTQQSANVTVCKRTTTTLTLQILKIKVETITGRKFSGQSSRNITLQRLYMC